MDQLKSSIGLNLKKKAELAITLVSEESRKGLSIAINEGIKTTQKAKFVCTNAAHAFVKPDFLKEHCKIL